METLSPEEQRVLQNELSSGEQLLWSGKPNPRVWFHSTDWYMIPFSLMWGGFAIFWEWGASGGFSGKGGGIFLTLWGIPFIVIGQYMIWGRFLYTAWKKKRVVYAVTNERILTLVLPPQPKSISMYLRRVPGISKSVFNSGIGTLKFGETPSIFSGRRQNIAGPDNLFLNLDMPVFCDIDNAAGVAAIIELQLRQAITTESTTTQ